MTSSSLSVGNISDDVVKEEEGTDDVGSDVFSGGGKTERSAADASASGAAPSATRDGTKGGASSSSLKENRLFSFSSSSSEAARSVARPPGTSTLAERFPVSNRESRAESASF